MPKDFSYHPIRYGVIDVILISGDRLQIRSPCSQDWPDRLPILFDTLNRNLLIYLNNTLALLIQVEH